MNEKDLLKKKKRKLVLFVILSTLICILLIIKMKEWLSIVLLGVLYGILILFIFDFYFNIIKMKAVQEEKIESENKLIKAELDRKKQQLQALESQINPHFLYNTLDSFRGLALEQGNKELSDMIEALSVMFKYSVKYDAEMVNINAELDYLKRYIQLQQMRFPNLFTYEENIECSSAKLLLEPCPRFVLQPLVENAIRHGLKNVRTGGHIIVSMGFRRNDFFILVEDNGCGIDMTEVSLLNQRLSRMTVNDEIGLGEQTTGIGIANVNRRIKMFCGEEYGLKISSTLGVGTQVEVSLPQYKEIKEEMNQK